MLLRLLPEITKGVPFHFLCVQIDSHSSTQLPHRKRKLKCKDMKDILCLSFFLSCFLGFEG